MIRKSLWHIVYLLGLIITTTSCADLLTTEEGAMNEFNRLPFANSELVALKVYENSGSSCFSIQVYAIYYDTRSFTEVADAVEVVLLNNGWRHDLLLSQTKETKRYYVLEKKETPSIETEVEPQPIDLHQYALDLTSLSLPANKPIDNTQDDGYFMVVLHYHPFPPNECQG